MGRLIPAGTGMEFYRKIKIPEEVIERSIEGGMEGEYAPEYLVEPGHTREGHLPSVRAAMAPGNAAALGGSRRKAPGFAGRPVTTTCPERRAKPRGSRPCAGREA
jgi:hypothetical protein